METLTKKAQATGKFAEYLTRNHVNVSALARATGVDYPRLQGFRTKGFVPRYDEAVKIARVLDVKVEELFDFPAGL